MTGALIPGERCHVRDVRDQPAVIEAVEHEPVARGVGERVEHHSIVQERRRGIAFVLDEDQVRHAHAAAGRRYGEACSIAVPTPLCLRSRRG